MYNLANAIARDADLEKQASKIKRWDSNQVENFFDKRSSKPWCLLLGAQLEHDEAHLWRDGRAKHHGS